MAEKEVQSLLHCVYTLCNAATRQRWQQREQSGARSSYAERKQGRHSQRTSCSKTSHAQ